jgi:hypothetical protein
MLEADDKTQVLAHGDRVEVFAPAAPAPARLNPEQLEVQRQRLQRLFGKSPAQHASPPGIQLLAENAAFN